MKNVALLLAICGLFFGCRRVPRLTDYRFPRDMNEYRAARTDSIVVVGSIRADVPVDQARKSRWEPDVKLQLHRMQIHIENVLRGSLHAGTTMPVYYFRLASSFTGPPPLGSWKGSDRNVFYIRPDAGVLRLACDGWNHCAFTVATGTHLNFKPDPKQPLDASLAEIYLTKGQGVSDADFADAVGRYGDSIPALYAVPKLRVLAASTNPDIHQAACYVLNSFKLPCGTTTSGTKP